jgi:hypothetical protein
MSPTKHELVIQRQEANVRAADLEYLLTEAQVSIANLQEDVGRAEAELVRADTERQEAERILGLDDSRLLTAVQNTARALGERDEAQVKLDAVQTQDRLRREWAPILETAQQQDIKWKKPMPEIDFGDEAIYVWALKAQEEMGELSAALLGGLIGKEGRGDVLEECYQLIAVLLRVARAAIDMTPEEAVR